MNQKDSMNALDQIHLLLEKRGTITRLARSVTTLLNGLPYYVVEVTSIDGTQYGIQAYGEEAMKLYAETMEKVGYAKDDKVLTKSTSLITTK